MIMDTHNSKATRISLKFGYIYGHYAHKYTWAQLSMNDLYSELSHIIWTIIMYNYFKPPKGVNKYMQLIILTLYGCDMTVPYKANSH